MSDQKSTALNTCVNRVIFAEMLTALDLIKLRALSLETAYNDHRAHVLKVANELRRSIRAWETLNNLRKPD